MLVGTLGIAEGLSLLPATIAMLCLARIYTAERDDDTLRLAMLFWTALGAGMLVNALLVQILVIVTLIALRFMDRDLSWLKRLLAAKGVPVALLIAAPWLIVRVLQDGIPYSGLGWQRLIEALGGAQDMKLRAMPGTFILALVLGFLPGTALIVPAISRLWSQRTDKLARFLIAWVLGYLVYLEALSSKPGTYMVQVMFPALAIAVAMLVVRKEESPAVSRGVLIPWPPLAALFPLLPLAAIYYVTRETPSGFAIILAAVVAALFWVSAREGRRGEWKMWAVSGVAALGLFAITLLGVVLPGIDKLWPARDIQRAIANCPASSLGILGYNEPSTRFVLNRNAGLSTGYSLARYADGKSDGLAVIAQSWSEQNPSALNAEQKAKLRPFACVNAINTMRGCALALTIVENAARPPCTPRSAYACSKPFTMNATAATRLKPCD